MFFEYRVPAWHVRVAVLPGAEMAHDRVEPDHPQEQLESGIRGQRDIGELER